MAILQLCAGSFHRRKL